MCELTLLEQYCIDGGGTLMTVIYSVLAKAIYKSITRKSCIKLVILKSVR